MLVTTNSMIIGRGISYKEYRTMIDQLMADGKTTGEDHSESMLNYSSMNIQRMNRLDKKTALLPESKKVLSELDENWVWLVLTEGWCGDASQNLPVIAKYAAETDKIDLRLFLRDEHPEIMDRYLTNGGKAIPKLVCFRADNMQELGTWGPRPDAAQQMVVEFKQNSVEKSKEDLHKELHLWYARDKSSTLQGEMNQLIRSWRSGS